MIVRTGTSAKHELGASALHAKMYTCLGADAATLHTRLLTPGPDGL